MAVKPRLKPWKYCICSSASRRSSTELNSLIDSKSLRVSASSIIGDVSVRTSFLSKSAKGSLTDLRTASRSEEDTCWNKTSKKVLKISFQKKEPAYFRLLYCQKSLMKNSFLFHLHRLRTIQYSVAQILNSKYLIDFFVRTTSYIYLV